VDDAGATSRGGTAPSDSPDVVIVGGGVAGLAAAIAVARRGFHSVVLEKRRAPGEIDRGDVIHDSILPILQRWDLHDALADYGPVQLRLFRMLNGRGQVIFEVDLEHDLARAARLTLVTHPDLERILERAAIASGLVCVRRETSGLDLLVEGSRVVGVRTAEGEVRAPLTIIASGAQSALRDRHFPPRRHHEYHASFYNARVKLLPQYADAGVYILGPSGVMVMAPLPKGEMRIGIQFKRARDSDAVSAKNFREVVAARCEDFPVEQLEFLDGHVYRLSRSLGRSLAIPGAVLVGDAAHTVHPAGGQGMNLAFQDAEVLAELLEPAKGHLDRLDRACALYSSQRRRQVKRVLRLTHFMGVLGELEQRWLIWIREWLLRRCNRSVLIKKLFVSRVINVG
jgi:2-polyprenyl-6-methoxyphenol hydroxylase-like FAD-dependent oxidoreductase